MQQQSPKESRYWVTLGQSILEPSMTLFMHFTETIEKDAPYGSKQLPNWLNCVAP